MDMDGYGWIWMDGYGWIDRSICPRMEYSHNKTPPASFVVTLTIFFLRAGRVQKGRD